jgi:hypothetical protein
MNGLQSCKPHLRNHCGKADTIAYCRMSAAIDHPKIVNRQSTIVISPR